jgi:hypothetical protein
MNTSTITRVASATLVTGVATLAFASPANAIRPDPQGSASDVGVTTSVTTDDGTNWSGIAAGSAGGVAVVGVGIATAVTLRRHRHQHAAA